MDPQRVRQDIPLLSQGITYLDNAATSLTPTPVLDKYLQFEKEYRANIHRGVHRLSQRASQEYENTHPILQRFFKTPNDGTYINTRNTTEGINGVALGLPLKPDSNVVTTGVEHHSNLLPWVRLRRQGKIKELRTVQPRNWTTGSFNLDDFAQHIDRHTGLVTITAASNVLGCQLPVKEIAKIAHDNHAPILVDAAQAAGHYPVDLTQWNADYVAFSGHKMLAPTGVGALYVAPSAPRLEPWFLGGGTIQKASADDYTLLPMPESHEAGTPNVGGWIALAAAAQYLDKLNLKDVETHERQLAQKIHDGLQQHGAVVYGPAQRQTGVVAFTLPGKTSHETATMCDTLEKVCIRSGHHCAMPITQALGIEGTARASVHAYNTQDDVDRLLRAVEKIQLL